MPEIQIYKTSKFPFPSIWEDSLGGGEDSLNNNPLPISTTLFEKEHGIWRQSTVFHLLGCGMQVNSLNPSLITNPIYKWENYQPTGFWKWLRIRGFLNYKPCLFSGS